MSGVAAVTISEWVREEQADLWDELHDAIRCAVDGVWSMRASNVARRIIGAARLVGPTAHGGVPWPLLAGGVYEAVLNAGATPVIDLPDAQEWRRLDLLMAVRGGTRERYIPAMAGTVAAINTDRETAWIQGDDE